MVAARLLHLLSRQLDTELRIGETKRRVVPDDSVPRPMTFFMFRAPDSRHPDFAALEVLAAVLGRGRGSRLVSATEVASAPWIAGGVWLSVSDTGNPRGAPLSCRREGVRRAEGARGQDCPDGRRQSSTRCVSA